MINYNIPKPKFNKNDDAVTITRKIRDWLNEMMVDATCMERYEFAKKGADHFLKGK